MAFWDKKKEEVVQKVETPVVPEKLESNVTLPEPETVVTPKSVEPAPEPMVEAPAVLAKPVVDAFTLAMFIWALYKLNVITRIQVRDFLDIIRKGEWPVDVVKYLSDEIKKLA